MIEFIYHRSKEFYAILPDMRAALHRLADKSEVDWTVDEILEDIDLERLTIIKASDDGVFILSEKGDYLDVRVGVAFSGHCKRLGEYYVQLHRAALAAGFKGITFASTRKGWQKSAKKFGFKPVSVTVTYLLEGDPDGQ